MDCHAFFSENIYIFFKYSLYSVPLELILSWNIFQIHFGVNSGATRFALENQAVNEATFRCPDELGWKPQVALLSNACYCYLDLQINLVDAF